MKDEVNYYYEVMSFDPKNVDATYQRLMDIVFSNLIGRNVKIYMDDMVVKCDSCQKHIKDLEEVFAELRKFNTRLNSEMWRFQEGDKFLGFMLTTTGI